MKLDYEWIKLGRGVLGDVEDTGWKDLIEQLLADLDQIMSNSERVLHLEQVKEKFGVLRFYCQVSDPNGKATDRSDVDDLIDRAEEQSSKTCIVCGGPGKIVNDEGWYRPLCEKDEEEIKRKYA